ncbi:BadF/BadG/BcrA/BcrD ATPase family protein [Nucisporomicrobium flavum]|uniref:BadF/BadG/BcrA/BcrD ATPase family protein n=1 Tax=Nucisporomicrobium flavum TaxID=2785915 RepID=UPI0018F54CA0|nr:BadF/BadG/BcrA/BcrD ATPase family protein [Nucisporomicrobium flavum]
MGRGLVVGVDAGATSTRCVVATPDGVVVGRGAAGGANVNSSGGDAAGALAAALRTALSTVDPAEIRTGVFGGAGAAGAGREAFRTAAARAWAAVGAGGEVVTVTDLEVAFVAGTPEPGGVLLLSGTGALAAAFSGGTLSRRCDGYGWLLGDEGSAVWIGLRAMRAAVAAVDGRGEPTALLAAACRWADVDRPAGDDLAQHLVAAGFARPPAALGGLAPAVSAAADAGDAVAQRICAAAAAKLLHTFDTVGPYAGDVVLAGSVLLSPGPVARLVRAGVGERTGTPPREALDGAGGAAVLALARLTGDRVPAAVHARLTGHDRRRRRSG